jgi:hypothetical protein
MGGAWSFLDDALNLADAWKRYKITSRLACGFILLFAPKTGWLPVWCNQRTLVPPGRVLD